MKDESVRQCAVTCKDFPLAYCDVAHRCVLDAGHSFSPTHGQIHEFETHLVPVKPRAVNSLPVVEKMAEALRGVVVMLNTNLKEYEHEPEPWTQRVRAALAAHEAMKGE